MGKTRKQSFPPKQTHSTHCVIACVCVCARVCNFQKQYSFTSTAIKDLINLSPERFSVCRLCLAARINDLKEKIGTEYQLFKNPSPANG